MAPLPRSAVDVLVFQDLPWPTLLDEARFLEQAGAGTLWVADHYAFPLRPAAPVFEAWTTLAALAASTTGLRLGSLVSNVATRHPAMLAKLVATVDHLSAGRVDIGVGAGGGDGPYRREYEWLGIPPLRRSERVDRLHEAVQILDQLLRQQRVTHHGTYFTLDDAPLVPVPVQQPRPPLFIAAQGPRSLRVVAEYADGWVSLASPTVSSADDALRACRERNLRLDEACQAIGRDSATLARLYFAGWSPAETPFASRAALEDFLARYRATGVERFIFSFASHARPLRPNTVGRSLTRAVLDAFAAELLAPSP